LRLWTAHEQNARPAQEIPEVKRLDLSEVILTPVVGNSRSARAQTGGDVARGFGSH
jgi:hypothetical protein